MEVNLEYEITEFVVKEREGIEKEIAHLLEEAPKNPILNTFLEDALLEEVRQLIAKEMNKSYFDVSLVIDKRFIHKWLKLQ